jgi:hypothetical protein
MRQASVPGLKTVHSTLWADYTTLWAGLYDLPGRFIRPSGQEDSTFRAGLYDPLGRNIAVSPYGQRLFLWVTDNLLDNIRNNNTGQNAIHIRAIVVVAF